MPLPSNSSQEILVGQPTSAGQTVIFDAMLYETVIIACPGLASAETASVGVAVGAQVAPTLPLNGTAATLTATNQSSRFPGRCRLSITTSATVALVPIYVVPGPARA